MPIPAFLPRNIIFLVIFTPTPPFTTSVSCPFLLPSNSIIAPVHYSTVQLPPAVVVTRIRSVDHAVLNTRVRCSCCTFAIKCDPFLQRA
jgi:hypothetical protein